MKQAVILSSKTLSLTLDPVSALPQSWIFTSETQQAESYGGSIKTIDATIQNKDLFEYTLHASVQDCRSSGTEAIFHCSVRFDNHDAVVFQLQYRLIDSQLLITLEKAQESDGWHLIELSLPSLVSCPQTESAQFIHNNHRGGYQSDLNHLDDKSLLRDDGRWEGYPNASVLPVLALIKTHSVCTMEVQGYVCNTELAFSDGIHFNIRVPYRIRGNGTTPDIPVNQKEICRIEFGGDHNHDGKINWFDAASIIHKNFPQMQEQFFDDKFVYIVQNNLGRQKEELTFQETDALLQRISNIIDEQPHVAFLTGWSQGGHDTSYPNAYTLNQNLGTDHEFFALKEHAKKDYHCTVSLNDNFDDMYLNEFTESRWFREEYVSRNQRNELETFETWNGVDKSYITGMASYMKNGADGEKRIQCHAETYQLEHALLIDAMSWWSIRHNWNPDCPASAVDNLVHGKFKIIDQFKEKYKINVLSELVRYPFIGKICVAFDNQVAYDKPSEQDVPFLRTALTNVMYYGGCGGDKLNIPDMLYHNAAKHPWLRRNETSERIADIYYLNYVPWFLLKKLELCDYSVKNGVYDLHLVGGSHIHLDYPGDHWFVEYQGKRILTDHQLTCPLGENKIAFYAKQNVSLSYPLPESTSVCTAKKLYDNGKENAIFVVQENQIIVECEANIPVIITLS